MAPFRFLDKDSEDLVVQVHYVGRNGVKHCGHGFIQPVQCTESFVADEM